MTFDRLIYVDRLKQAGVEESVARAHAEALREALLDTVATKADLAAVKGELEGAISELRADLRATTASLEQRMTALDHKMELIARDLTIRGAGGLIELASLMIGLKLFG